MNFEQLMSYVDEQTVQEILGKPALELVTLIDSKYQTPTRMKELLLDLYGPAGLLLDTEIRSKLFNVMPTAQAEELVATLSLQDDQDPFAALANFNPSRNSINEEKLFEFFDVPVPPVEEKIKLPDEESLIPSYALFPHQREALEKLQTKLSEYPYRAMLHMPTGSGKTRTTMNLIARQLNSSDRCLVVWLAHSSELCEQAVQEFKETWKYLGDRKTNIYRYWGNHELDSGQPLDGLLVAGLSKLYHSAKKDINFLTRLGEKTSLVVMDEAHQAIAETYSFLLDTLVVMNEDTKLLGLTATPGRSWLDIEEDQKLSSFFGQNKVMLEIDNYDNPVDYLIDEGYLADPEFKNLLHQSGIQLSKNDYKRIESGFEIPNSVLHRLADDSKRNLAIIHRIEELAKRHSRILMFALTVEHSELIASVLRAQGLQASSVTGKTSSLHRKEVIDKYKEESDNTRILCNYGVLTTGFDAPQTSAAVIARPTNSLVLYSQMVGRAIRGEKAGGNKTAEIVTVIDQKLPGFKSVAEAFTNWEDVWS